MHRIRFVLKRLSAWINDHTIVQCLSCEKVMFLKDSFQEYTSTGTKVFLCGKCHKEIFKPWSNIDGQEDRTK